MPQIRPIKDLRNTTEISELCHTSREPIYITKNGYGDLVVMSMEVYQDMMECLATDQAIAEAEAEFAATGEASNAHEVLTALRKKYFG